MKKILTLLVARFARKLAVVCDFKTRVVLFCFAHFTLMTCRNVESYKQSSKSRIRLLHRHGTSLMLRGEILRTAVEDYQQVHGVNASPNAALLRQAAPIVRNLLKFGSLAAPLYVSGLTCLAQDRLGDVTIAICQWQNANNQRRLVSLGAILTDGGSPIFLCQVITWLFTSSQHNEVVLGDLVEGFHTRAHHRVPGKSLLHLMISLCPACHAKIHRTRAIVRLMPPLLLLLWREVHPKAHEQTALNFNPLPPPAKSATLFPMREIVGGPRRNSGHL